MPSDSRYFVQTFRRDPVGRLVPAALLEAPDVPTALRLGTALGQGETGTLAIRTDRRLESGEILQQRGLADGQIAEIFSRRRRAPGSQRAAI